MTGVRFADVQGRPAEFLNLTSLTLEEFEVLVAPFEAAFQDHMAAWRLDGKPRTSHRFTVYRTCPLATPEDRLFFLLTYLKTYTVQVVQGRLFGMSQSKANQLSCCRRCSRRCAASAMLPPAPSRLSRTGWLSRRGTRVAGGACALPSLRTQSWAGLPPFAHDGTERRVVHPQNPAEQTDCYSGKKKDPTVKNILLVNALLIILFLSDTVGGRIHDKRLAEPYPLPAG